MDPNTVFDKVPETLLTFNVLDGINSWRQMPVDHTETTPDTDLRSQLLYFCRSRRRAQMVLAGTRAGRTRWPRESIDESNSVSCVLVRPHGDFSCLGDS